MPSPAVRVNGRVQYKNKNDTVMTLFIEREVVGIGDRCAFTLAAVLGLNKVTMDQKQEGCTFNLVLWI